MLINTFPGAAPSALHKLTFPVLDLPGQNGRRQKYFAEIRRRHRSYFRPSGEWKCPTTPPETREWLWQAFAWLEGDRADQDFASKLITAAPEIISGHSGREDHAYCIFACTHALHLLVLHGERLSCPARARLASWARRTIMDNPGGARADLQFHGYNDNMPAKATLGLVLGGEYFENRRAVEHGLWNLHQLRLLLTRRGVISEHCSPTYSPLTLTNLTEIARYSTNAEARGLAEDCCHHIWAELLAHYHAPTRSVAGPYSRAYAVDSAGHISALHFMLWQVFGDDFVANPLDELFSEESKLIRHHRGDRFFFEGGFSFLAACQHHPPARLLDWLRLRRFPFNFSATTERGEGGAKGDFHADKISIRMHQTETFALGTSDGDWTQQAERWQLVYRRTEGPEDHLPRFSDRRHLSMRYIVNDDLPGITAPSPRGEASGEVDFTREMGGYHTLQHGATSLVAAHPMPSLAGRPIHRMGLAILIPEHLDRVEEITFEHGHVWLTDGPFQLAIRPLGVTRWGNATPKFREIRSGAWRLLFFPNYEGPERTFTREELDGTTNGFVAVCSGLDETSDYDSEKGREAFRRAVIESTLRDTVWVNLRTIFWEGSGDTMEMSYGLSSNRLRFAAINGIEPESSVWHADGLTRQSLPFTSRPSQKNPYPFPYGPGADGWEVFPSGQST